MPRLQTNDYPFYENLVSPLTKMKKERETLRIIKALPEPRHLFILPGWVDPVLLDRLIAEGYLTCQRQQRDNEGVLLSATDLQLTARGERLIHPRSDWHRLAVKGSLAGASFVAISVLILYWG
jgi:hypothetical protein